MWLPYLLLKFLPKNKTLIAFGTHTSSFSGNIKSLFLRQDTAGYQKVFISDEKALVRRLTSDGYTAYSKYSFQGIWTCLKAGTYIYSSYPSDINFWLSAGTKYINLWHGTPIKKIERDVTAGKYSLRNNYKWIFRILKPNLLAKSDTLLVSSEYEEKCFKSAFEVGDENIFRAFPPRLESLLDNNSKNNKQKTILYTPTWRDNHSFSFSKYVNLNLFNTFLQVNDMIFIIKLHPSDKSLGIAKYFSNITVVNQKEDVYAHLKDADILVSDYSSMVFESLYLSKPVVLFCPDYETYQKNSREFYIDPCHDLPIEVSYTQNELEEAILRLIKQKKIDAEKFKPYKPYDIQNNLLLKLVNQAHDP